MADIVKEKQNKEQHTSISIKGMNTILSQMENCFYEIQKNDITGSGFVCKIPFSNDLKYFLITSYSLLNEEDINLNKTIKLKSVKKNEQKIQDGNEEIHIKIDITRIKACINKEITILEIKPNKDKISLKIILDLDKEAKVNNIDNLELENNKKSIYIIDKDKLTFSEKAMEGSFCSPILSLETFKIIGINSGKKENKNNIIYMNYLIDELNKKNNTYKNEIELIYIKNTKSDKEENIFGNKFVDNLDNLNENDIELIINEQKSKLVKKWKLKEGENKIKMIIKNKLSNFECMFEGCDSLRNISGLKNLDTNCINNFSFMFSGCSSLSDITSLENWNLSNAINLNDMFRECKSLSDLRPLKNWNVSKVQNFSNMFYQCSSLLNNELNITPLKDWNVSNGINFSNMFRECDSLKDIKALKDWDVSKANDFSSMFRECKKLNDIESLKHWKVLKATNFSCMFKRCELLADIRPLKDWKVSESRNLNKMFSRCSMLSNVEPLTKWDISKCENFSKMFSKCKKLSNKELLRQWNLPDNVFNEMFVS